MTVRTWGVDRPGRPLVVLAGLQGVSEVFAPLAERADRPVVGVDLPEVPWADLARAVERRMVDHVGEPAHLLTGSLGGLVAWRIGARRMASLAVVATLPHPTMARWRSRVPLAVLTRLPGPVVGAAYRLRTPLALLADGVGPRSVWRAARASPPGWVVQERLTGALAGDLPPLPDVPLRWVLGDDDPAAPWSEEEVRRWCPTARVVRVPGGHRPYSSHPGPLLATLAPWWNQIDAEPPGEHVDMGAG